MGFLDSLLGRSVRAAGRTAAKDIAAASRAVGNAAGDEVAAGVRAAREAGADYFSHQGRTIRVGPENSWTSRPSWGFDVLNRASSTPLPKVHGTIPDVAADMTHRADLNQLREYMISHSAGEAGRSKQGWRTAKRRAEADARAAVEARVAAETASLNRMGGKVSSDEELAAGRQKIKGLFSNYGKRREGAPADRLARRQGRAMGRYSSPEEALGGVLSKTPGSVFRDVRSDAELPKSARETRAARLPVNREEARLFFAQAEAKAKETEAILDALGQGYKVDIRGMSDHLKSLVRLLDPESGGEYIAWDAYKKAVDLCIASSFPDLLQFERSLTGDMQRDHEILEILMREQEMSL